MATHFGLWIPSDDLPALSTKLHLTDIVEMGKLHKATLLDPGLLSRAKPTHMLVKVGRWLSPDGDVVGTYGRIRSVDHPLYPGGLFLTSYDEHDVRYHSKTMNVAERWGIPRIEVKTEDRGENLDNFVQEALNWYMWLGVRRDPAEFPKESHLLFYARQTLISQVAQPI